MGLQTPILDRFSINTGVSLKFLHPPLQRCIRCTGNLHVNNTWNFKGKPPSQVKVLTMTGPAVYSKVGFEGKIKKPSSEVGLTNSFS